LIEIKTVEFPGADEIINNITKYREMFLNDTMIAFRNAHCDRPTQERIMQAFGDAFGWWPNSNEVRDSGYVETHHNHMNEQNTEKPESTMLGWHLEHVQLTDGIYVGASWCMNLFRCKPGAGLTYFVDTLKLFESLGEEDKEILKNAKCELTSVWGGHDEGNLNKTAEYSVVKDHWILGKDTLRAFFASSEVTQLKTIYGRRPTEEESKKFRKALDYALHQVHSNTEIRMVHNWQEGDMLILDMFRLAHSVGGGFDKDQRRLDGIFGRIENWK
jgi:alpha-ketoglutarate-dependent taurine dioxygenase